MREDIKKRMNEMYLRDCFMAWFDVVFLWAVVIFVLIAILGIVQDSNIRLVLYVASFMLMLFNTASVFAMTRHFKEDKEFIYGLDIKHLDANRAAKNNR
ncbi:MAG: hypothetical protein A3I83_03390 [Methylotenera sp. RIFCSPLOWO2_02_FULL_45_14]|nr:MAG: hypothetical protein A3I83_03390 [Methylotenera sp. RIFCSPLOWO2_02_FULL_45_14]